MDADRAIADLTEISSQIEAVVLAGPGGEILGTTLDDAGRAQRFAEAAQRLVEDASAAAPEGSPVSQLEAALDEGSVFVVRQEGRTIAAVTSPEPTVGLVFYDLKSCLQSLDPPVPPRPSRARKKGTDGAA